MDLEEVRERIKNKLARLKTRAGQKMLKVDLFSPMREKEKDRLIVRRYSDTLDQKIKVLEPLIRSLRSHIDYIGDQDKLVAAYLLIGKSFMALKSITLLVRKGYSFQAIELIRSSIESLQLAHLFLEDRQQKKLEKWFYGEIVPNRKARKALSSAANTVSKNISSSYMKDILAYIYSTYSSYTHSSYGALFEYIDVFREDFDFGQYSQFHFTRENLDLVGNLYVNILLTLKNFYIRVNDRENLLKTESILENESIFFVSKQDLNKLTQK